MNIGIVGVGVCGGALKEYFDQTSEHALSLYDPRLSYLDDLNNCDVGFICVPIPTSKFKLDFSILEESISRFSKSTPIFLRSTALPGTADKYGLHSMPEFLTERKAVDEMFRLPIITGCKDTNLLDELFPDKEVLMVSNKEAELIKYAHNVFGAVKVNYFNIINDICKDLELNYENVRTGVLMSGFINKEHTMVPGPDGRTGYGGNCFLKDIAAFYGMFGYDVIKDTMKDNERFRV